VVEVLCEDLPPARTVGGCLKKRKRKKGGKIEWDGLNICVIIILSIILLLVFLQTGRD
jgi:hypothetical protein